MTQPRESISTRILVPLIVVVFGAILVGGSAPWWWKLIFPDPTSSPTPGQTFSPTTGPTLASEVAQTLTPLPSTLPPVGCVLHITNPFATISKEPSHTSEEVGDVPAGDYATSDTRLVDWAGKNERWFEITASGRTGWIVYNSVMVDSKSADCP